MKKSLMLAAASTAAVAMVPSALLQAPAASASVRHQQVQTGAITIESWLYAVPSENVLSGTVWDCFKLTGAINDEGGGPTWTNDTTYGAPNTMTSGGSARPAPSAPTRSRPAASSWCRRRRPGSTSSPSTRRPPALRVG